ncbi:GDSL esterase/lipase At3g48460-like [Triticum urartu]|uniref:GDSL esterase/lipase At3g48460-like n=1 Tax=Triticum urartu TaxID=4572 RepID=UPI0020434725|nr:GDSL esterase/lipase At3g48460-like [Triticum urartu]
MAASTAVSCLCLLLVAAVTFSVAAAAPAPAPPPPFRTVYAFGDSFTDTGNTHSTTGPYSYGYVSNPPYGATFFHRSTNRYSDGRLVVDFLATDALALPSFLPPYLSLAAPNASSKSSKYYGANFAVAGATAIEHDFFAKNNLSIDITPQSIMTELGWFDAHLKTRQAKKEEIGEALYWVGEIGANDYAYSFMAADSIPPERIRTMAVDRVTTFLEGLLKRGARYVVVQGLPLTGCLPLAMTLARPEDRDNLSCVASVNKQSMDHNHHLQAGIHRLRQAHPGAVLAYADYYAAHLAVMRSPARYGFAEPFKTCCGSGGGAYNFEIFSTCGSPEVPAACAHPARYVNWDGVHMTEAMYKVVAGMFFRDAAGTFIRPSFGSLLAAARKGHGN